MPRQVDREHAPRARSVSDTENAVVRLDASPADCQSEADAGSIRAILREWQKHPFCAARRKASAIVLDIDPNAIGRTISAQRDVGAFRGELECVLQHVSHRRQQHVTVGINSQVGVDEGNRELASVMPRLEGRGGLEFRDEVRNGHKLVSHRQSSSHPHVGEGPIDEVAHRDQAAIQHRACRSGCAYVARFDDSEGERRRTSQVAELMRKRAETFVQRLNAPVRKRKIALVGKFGDGIGDGIVETAVERSKFFDVDRRTVIDRQFRNRLAEIAIVMDNLVYGEPVLQQLAPMPRSRRANFGRYRRTTTRRTRNLSASQRFGGLLNAERLDELIEEKRYSMLKFHLGRRRGAAPGDLRLATPYKLGSMRSKEFVQRSIAWQVNHDSFP